MLSTRHLIFLEVATLKSFSKAAQTMYISQPAISKHVKALEDFYQTKLINRYANHIELTEAGILLVEKLQEVKIMQDQMEFELSSLSKGQQPKGFMRLGASTTITLYVLPQILSGFHKRYPQLEISLLNRNSEIVLDALLNKEINLGIIEKIRGISKVDTMPFLEDEVILVASKKNKKIKTHYAVPDLTKLPIALRESGSGTLNAIKVSLEENGLKLKDLNAKVRLGGTEALKNFILQSDCLGFFPRRSVLTELKNGALQEIFIDKFHISRSFFFITRKNESTPLNDQFIKLAKHSYNL